MRSMLNGKRALAVNTLFGLLLIYPYSAPAQETRNTGANQASQSAKKDDLSTVESLLRKLEAEVQDLKGQVKDLKTRQESARAESAALRKELEQARSQLVATTGSANAVASEQAVPETSTHPASIEDRMAKLEENQQLENAKITEQSQTKVESASKYRARMSGIMLFNMYGERGSVLNVDFPQLAFPPGLLSSGGSFGASVRQSQIGIQAFGRRLLAHVQVRIFNLILRVDSPKRRTARRSELCGYGLAQFDLIGRIRPW